jgi:hypothetical protein
MDEPRDYQETDRDHEPQEYRSRRKQMIDHAPIWGRFPEITTPVPQNLIHHATWRSRHSWIALIYDRMAVAIDEIRTLIVRMSRENFLWGAAPWRVAQTRVQGVAGYGVSLHTSAEPSALAKLADLPAEPSLRDQRAGS